MTPNKLASILENSKLFLFIYKYIDGLTLAIAGIWHSLRIISRAVSLDLFTNNSFFESLMVYFVETSLFYAGLLLFASLMKLLGILFNLRKTRQIGNIITFAYWMTMFFSFLFSHPPNSISLLAFTYIVLSFKLILKEGNRYE